MRQVVTRSGVHWGAGARDKWLQVVASGCAYTCGLKRHGGKIVRSKFWRMGSIVSYRCGVRAKQSKAEQSRAEQSRAEQSNQRIKEYSLVTSWRTN